MDEPTIEEPVTPTLPVETPPLNEPVKEEISANNTNITEPIVEEKKENKPINSNKIVNKPVNKNEVINKDEINYEEPNEEEYIVEEIPNNSEKEETAKEVKAEKEKKNFISKRNLIFGGITLFLLLLIIYVDVKY